MSLDFNFTGIKDYKTVCYDLRGELASGLKPLIFGTMAVGLGTLTEKNIDEWMWRITFLNRIESPIASYRGEGWPTRKSDISKFIGLRTNADTLTRSQWLRTVSENLSRDVDAAIRQIEREEREAQKEKV